TFQQIYYNLEDIGFEMLIKNYLANVFGFPSIPGNLIYLSQNYPNPFNPHKIVTTTISFYIAEFTENAEIKIYNIKGQLVKKLSIYSNQFSIKWDGKNESGKPVSSGIYLYQLSTKGARLPKRSGGQGSASGGKSNNYKSEIKKMILIK
ncbi:MAG: T9SS type A sorting domain-containing protein, partial [Candidatus Cloacimonetes bacterium]|nr:T9SS type A sorting domain-containing protein [Candidatus Cloacimonadota bacterium]